MLNNAIEYASQNPCKAEAHEKLADEYYKSGRWMPAIAEYRTSITLGGKNAGAYINLAAAYLCMGRVNYAIAVCNEAIKQWKDISTQNLFINLIRDSTDKPSYSNDAYSHNTYYRLMSISEHLTTLFGKDTFSILDIGGGQGDLSLFLPNAEYVLAEPLVNGISGLSLPFEDKSFDSVIACHVLEHVPGDLRESFLDQLCKKARYHVILLNPFQSNNNNLIEQLVFELYGAEWAKEHLECVLPKIEDIEKYAEDRGIEYRIIPNGSQAVTAAVVFLDYFAGLSGNDGDWIKVNQLLNKYDLSDVQNSGLPNAYMIELDASKNQLPGL